MAQIKKLHQQLETNVSQISVNDVKDGVLIDVIKSGKWDDAAVKKQLAAFSNIEQQARYYRVKYYFDLSKVLTPEQRKLVQKISHRRWASNADSSLPLVASLLFGGLKRRKPESLLIQAF